MTRTAGFAAIALALGSALVRPAAAEEPPLDGAWSETVTVRGRLGTGGPRRAEEDLAGVEVHDAADIAASGARSLPEYLATLPSVAVADETGNGRQLGLDLRGFAGGSGATAVLVDGVRVNDPDTNLAALETIPLQDVERIEIVKGPRGATVGGGSLAGTIHVVRRRAAPRAGGEVVLRAGSFGLAEARGHGTAPAGRGWRLLGSGGHSRAEGFRDRGGYRESSGRVEAAREGRAVSLGLSWSHQDGRWEQPGALTEEEWKADPASATWNWLDFQEATSDLLALRLAPAARDRRTDWTAALSWRARRAETLSTGRTRYGFLTRSESAGAAATFEGLTAPRGSRFAWRYGGEVSSERLSPRGYATDSVEDGRVDALELWSDTDVDWERVAAFAGLEARLPRGVRLEAGLRHDASRVSRRGEQAGDGPELEPVDDASSFAGTSASLALGGTHGRGLRSRWRATWSQSFQAPSSIQLFAFPGYGSNPELRPARGAGLALELGVAGARWSADVGLFSTDVADEIVYDDAERRNENAARTRRLGAELSLVARPHRLARVTADLAIARALFRDAWGGPGGAQEGDRVPLVPESRARLALELGPFRGATVDLAWRRTGEAPLGSDFDGDAEPLPAWEAVSLGVRRAWTAKGATLEIQASADNLLDRAYATRGIEAPGGPYFTPAPTRALTLGFTALF